jgi:hypothetical protein
MPLLAKIALAAVAGIFLFAFVASFFRGKPPETYFFCARCKLSTRHNERTIEARRSNRATSSSGCLGILVVGVVGVASSIAAFCSSAV